MKWFKFYGQDWLTDIKVMRMPLEDKMCFITLLCLAANDENPGVIKNCNEEAILQLTHLYNDPLDDNNEYIRAVGILKRLNDNKMITYDNAGNVIIVNFAKRQGKNLTGYERVKRYRDRKNGLIKPHKHVINDNTNDNAMITSDKSRVDKSRVDKNNILNSEQGSLKINELVELFKPLNPLTYKKWYGNKTQRAAIGRLKEALGDKLEISINTAVQANGIKYAPTITTPLQLEEKLSALRAFVDKEKSNSKWHII